MPVPIILAAAAVAASLPLLWWAVAGIRTPGRRLVAQNLAGGSGSTDLRQLALRRGAGERAVRPAVNALVERSRSLTPAGWIAALERRIELAGRPPAWPLQRVLAAKLLLGAVGAGIGFLLFSADPSGRKLLLAAGITVLGYAAPDLILHSRGAARQDAIALALPDTLDQMTICVEAGLGFEAAMARAGRTGEGPLAQELVRTLQEMQMGIQRTVALRSLADRTKVADLRHFTAAVIQAESYGVAVAKVLRVQAAELRVKRRQRAEERAMKMPVKIIFPVILCILPALFTVVMGPGAIRIVRTMIVGGGF
ncbi:MAG: type II secretion system F family protein [Egibacteraceae bacterium]